VSDEAERRATARSRPVAPELIVIGCSLGGMHALQTILSGLPREFCLPIVIAQHRHKRSNEGLPAALRRVTHLEVVDADDLNEIAAYGGLAGGADVILVPERPFRLSQVCGLLEARKKEGRAFSIIVVAEDAHPHPDEPFLNEEQHTTLYRHEHLGGIGEALATEIERCTDIQARVTKLSPRPASEADLAQLFEEALNVLPVARGAQRRAAATRGRRLLPRGTGAGHRGRPSAVDQLHLPAAGP